MYDVIVIGGGPAGLSAALMLGRCRRRVLLCDSGRPRNRRSRALHGYLTRDGISPAEFNALGRSELAGYGIECRAVEIDNAAQSEGGFAVSMSDGGQARGRFLLLATGVEDDLPRVAEIEACYGRSVFHCPYCDGWEWRDRRIAVLGEPKQAVPLALSMKTWSPHIILCTNGSRLDRRAHDRIRRNSIAVRTERVASVDHDEGALRRLAFETGDAEPCDALFFTTGQHQKCDIAVRLGCAFNRHGTVNTGKLSETNVPGVFVAGDASHDAQFVVVAAAEGVKAALAINQAMQRQELAQ
jgi:thioredoxin reductase